MDDLMQQLIEYSREYRFGSELETAEIIDAMLGIISIGEARLATQDRNQEGE